MTADRRLDRRIADYYAAEPPQRAPDRVLAASLATIEQTPQRRVLSRVPWRFQFMSSFAKLAAAALAVVAVVAIGFALYSNNGRIGSVPTQTPAPTPTPAVTAVSTTEPLSETFTSAIHGMAVDHPAGWTVTPGAGPWTTSLPGTDDPPSRDTIAAPEPENVFIGLASQPLAGRSDQAWIGEIADDPSWGDSCDTTDTQPVTVDGAAGVATLCPERPLNALVADGQRGYFIVLYGSDDRAWFDEILATVQLDPEAAVD